VLAAREKANRSSVSGASADTVPAAETV